MAQGFVKSLNLQETPSEADRGIFNNLGGEGIVEDIRLFSGNTRRQSVLLASEYTTDGDDIIVTGDGRVPFSNRTQVTHNGTTYTVTLSNALDRFQLRTAGGNAFVPTGDLVRSDEITIDNLSNMNVRRNQVVRDAGSGAQQSDTTSTNEESGGIFNFRSIAGNYSVIEEGLGIYYYKKSRIPLTYEDSIFNRRVTFNGNIRITNGTNEPQSDTSPGLFIKGPTGAVRAFSDISNPWSENGTKLQTTANNAAAYDLVLNQPDLLVPTSEIQSESGDAGSYTHKMKVMVKSGSHDDTNSSYETFYLLLTT